MTVGIENGSIIREDSSGDSGYWRIHRANALTDLGQQDGGLAAGMNPDGNQIGGWYYGNSNLRYGRIFQIRDDWDNASDIVIEIEFCTWSAATPPGDVVFPIYVRAQANGSESYTTLTVSDATTQVGGATAYHKNLATTTISSGDVSPGDYLQIGVAFDPVSSDVSATIFQGLIVKYKTKYPTEEV